MSLPRPSGIKTPAASKLARPAGAPQKSGLMQPGTLAKAQSAIAKSARAAGLNSDIAEKYAADTVHALAGEEDLTAPPPPLDDYIIGDRVFVSGSKPGYIAFLGETQFAPGEWAGVVLDNLIGKNDGSVNGVKYFQCEAKRGVFCRISKLSRTPGISQTNRSADDGLSEISMPVNGDNNNGAVKRATTPSLLQRPTTPSHHESRIARPTTPSLPRPVHKSLSSSSSSLNKGPVPVKVKSESLNSSTPNPAMGLKHNLNIGDRVVVSGSKLGTLRYVGPADFAKGQWAGIELDDPLGKNDGAVAGKRYFDCHPRYGLFAPVHKVTKMAVGTTPSPMTRSLGSAGLRLSRERSGSQESVSSLSSATSSASRPRVRLGVSGYGNNQASGRAGQRPSTLNISATTSALQKALKEKEEHIEQLLRERDLERSEVARAAAQVDEAQDQLSQLKVEKDRHIEETEENIAQLRARVQKLTTEKHELQEKLEDEKRKVEDLQFQIEEEVISKDDLESRTEEEEARIRELEKSLKKERDKVEKLENDLSTFKATIERQDNQLKAMEETQTSYLDQVEELTHKLTQAEVKIQAHDSSRLEEGAKTSQVSLELAEKMARISEQDDFLSLRNKEVKQLQDRHAEMKDELESRSAKQEKLQSTIEELTDKLKANEVFSNDLSSQLQNLNAQNADIQRQLASSQDRNKQLIEEKSQLERQIGETMKNSGDSSNQLTMLNDQLGQKTRKIEDLQADLSTSTQKWHNLNNQLETSMREKDREIENLNVKHEHVVNTLTSNLEDVQRELDKTKMKHIAIEKDFESEKETLVKRKDNEISELKQQLEVAAENLSKQEIQTQAHKQVLDKITMEKEAVQFEREKLEKQIKRFESERDSLNNELIQLKVSMSKSQSSEEQAIQQKSAVEEKLQDLVEDKERLEKAIAELQKCRDEVQSEKEKVMLERDQYQREVMVGRAAVQQKDMMVEELQKELERQRGEVGHLQETINQLSQQSSDSGVIQSQLAEQRSVMDSVKNQLSQRENAVKELNQKLEERDTSVRSIKIELEESQETVTLLEESIKDVETERDSLKAQLQTALDARQEHAKLMELNQELNSEIETIKQRKEVETIKTTQDGLQHEVDNSSALLQQRDRDIQGKISQISNLENENSMLTGYKVSNEKLEREIAELRDKVNKLQSKLVDTQSNANVINNIDNTGGGTNNAIIDKLKEENESGQHQVEFLNSVIVDLQHKNDELKTRLEVMEIGVANGNADDMDLVTPTRRTAPRVFCDICDVFDKHETEDCPLQEMSDSPPPSQYHGERNQVRPYCDICEEFHEPCSSLSVRKVSESGAGNRIDPKDLVQDWVKKVDSVTSELAAESEKVFGDDMEFYHVQRDASDVPGFRDSGYYDGVCDAKSPFDTKAAARSFSEAIGNSLKDKKTFLESLNTDDMCDGISKPSKAGLDNMSDRVAATNSSVKYVHSKEPVPKISVGVKENKLVTVNRPDKLQTANTTQPHENKTPVNVPTPTSSRETSGSDSEYQSGIDSLGSDVDSPAGMGTPDIETSVDTGEVFTPDSPTGNDQTKAAENCVIS